MLLNLQVEEVFPSVTSASFIPSLPASLAVLYCMLLSSARVTHSLFFMLYREAYQGQPILKIVRSWNHW